ncbi:putative signal peptide protein [Puccinia sorghi]|uniref:Putative signal peptide protein n=1 Tax=Puccinia sorghi TaxID=27349 RepID=A0A0L6VE80_9BASI|nr:putative signal peptide protein [Puccinia sorghi]
MSLIFLFSLSSPSIIIATFCLPCPSNLPHQFFPSFSAIELVRCLKSLQYSFPFFSLLECLPFTLSYFPFLLLVVLTRVLLSPVLAIHPTVGPRSSLLSLSIEPCTGPSRMNSEESKVDSYNCFAVIKLGSTSSNSESWNILETWLRLELGRVGPWLSTVWAHLRHLEELDWDELELPPSVPCVLPSEGAGYFRAQILILPPDIPSRCFPNFQIPTHLTQGSAQWYLMSLLLYQTPFFALLALLFYFPTTTWILVISLIKWCPKESLLASRKMLFLSLPQTLCQKLKNLSALPRHYSNLAPTTPSLVHGFSPTEPIPLEQRLNPIESYCDSASTTKICTQTFSHPYSELGMDLFWFYVIASVLDLVGLVFDLDAFGDMGCFVQSCRKSERAEALSWYGLLIGVSLLLYRDKQP